MYVCSLRTCYTCKFIQYIVFSYAWRAQAFSLFVCVLACLAYLFKLCATCDFDSTDWPSNGCVNVNIIINICRHLTLGAQIHKYTNTQAFAVSGLLLFCLTDYLLSCLILRCVSVCLLVFDMPWEDLRTPLMLCFRWHAEEFLKHNHTNTSGLNGVQTKLTLNSKERHHNHLHAHTSL